MAKRLFDVMLVVVILALLLGMMTQVAPADSGLFQSPFISPLMGHRPPDWWGRWVELPKVCEWCKP